MFLVAFDPQTDFTIAAVAEETLGDGLNLGEAVGGTYVFTPEGEQNIQALRLLCHPQGQHGADRHRAGPDHVS